jgi:uncharacterized protein (TIGR03435 family)
MFRPVPPIMVIAGLAFGFAGALRCQQAAAKRPTFAVASVKLDKTCERPMSRLPTVDPVTVRLSCVTVRLLIRFAYGVYSGAELHDSAPRVVGGPAWIDSDIYSVDAKPETKSTTAVMMGPMMQALLEDRFQLRVHTEPRDTPVYFLTVAEPNLKLRPAKDVDCVPRDLSHDSYAWLLRTDPEALRSAPKPCEGFHYGGPVPNGTALDLSAWTMSEFAGLLLPNYAGRPVIDNTGLKGRFDMHLEFDPRPREQKTVLLNGEEVTTLSDDSTGSFGITIFTALRKQLGLELTPGTAPLDVIVVDHVERPSAN